MSSRPSYAVHQVQEKDVTVDWFFGSGHRRLAQLVLVVIGWIFVILPVGITLSALVNRNDDTSGWWSYHEGFVMWEVTMIFLGILTVVFIVGFLVLHRINRHSERDRAQRDTYDTDRLARRVEVTEAWYASKFGPQDLRKEQRTVRIEPHGDIETYELRGLFHKYEVD